VLDHVGTSASVSDFLIADVPLDCTPESVSAAKSCSRVAARRSPGKNDTLPPLLVAAIPVTGPYCFLRFLLAILF
jgi:hypothetical protein